VGIPDSDFIHGWYWYCKILKLFFFPYILSKVKEKKGTRSLTYCMKRSYRN
jgi:hypothetical protein